MANAEQIQFRVFTADQIADYSVCEILHNDAFTRQGQVCENGPCDLRLGAFDQYPCKTCHNTQACPGHFGHIVLCRAMYNINFLPQVVKILDTLCLKCSRIRLTDEELKTSPLAAVYSTRKKPPTASLTCVAVDALRSTLGTRTSCPHCNMKCPKITQQGGYIMLYHEQGGGTTDFFDATDTKAATATSSVKTATSSEYLHADRVFHIFASIPKEHVALLQLPDYEPSDLLFTNLPVLPNTERPTFDRFESGHQRSVDKLTFKLREIIMQNKKLATTFEKKHTRALIEPQILLLQDAITHFFTNAYMNQSYTLQRNIGAAYKRGTLSDGAPLHARLKGKSGQLRGNLMGKRVDMTARTVIVGDPALDLNQVRVPHKICMNLTVPERVTAFNQKRLQALVNAGPLSLVGANAVIRDDTHTFDLRFIKDRPKEMVLQVNDIVERHMGAQDVIMFNRQPTLHRMSFLAMNVVPGPGNAFGMNVCATQPFNADFDGDEMNLHLAQSLTATAEERSLMLIDQHIITPQSAKPVLGFVQDCMTSMFELSKPDVRLREDQAMTLYMQLKYPQQPFVRRPHTTGVQMFSYMLPSTLHYNAHGVVIENGQLLTGRLTSKVLGTSTGGLIHTMSRYPVDPGASIAKSLAATQAFISDGQRLGIAYFAIRGFTINVNDLMTSDASQQQITDFLADGRTKAIVETQQVAKYDRQKSQKELNILARLDKATSDAGGVAQQAIQTKATTPFDNNVQIMLEAGSKGKPSNVMQMSACVGQQIISGFRPTLGYEMSGRTLPHYTAEESQTLPEARGFIRSSFVQGLRAQDFFSAAQGGREGMTDTSIKSVTGDTVILIHERDAIARTTGSSKYATAGVIKAVAIGPWIDHLLAKASTSDVIHYPAELNTEILTFGVAYPGITIPTVNARGQVFWAPLTAVTRHDHDGTLFKIVVGAKVNNEPITVTVPRSKSLLVWDDAMSQLVTKRGDAVRFNDRVPVAHQHTLFKGASGPELVAQGYINERDRREDISLKPIVHIEEIRNVPADTKLYDVTVPKTYNFILANGLGVRDTRDSGYFTRKLVKFFENATIAYDQTVRVNGPAAQIIQFAYGDDNMDPMFLSLQHLPLYRSAQPDVQAELSALACDDPRWIQNLSELREKVCGLFPNRGSSQFYLPILIHHLIRTASTLAPVLHYDSDDASTWFDDVDRLITTTLQPSPNDVVCLHLKAALAPQRVHHLSPHARQWVLQKVHQGWAHACVAPGEKVGIVAAQSFGQLAVQATLNTCWAFFESKEKEKM